MGESSSSGLSFSDTTGGNTHTVNYYEQLLNTYQASPSVPSTWDATGPSIDSHSITNCGSTSPCMSATFSTSRTNDIIVVMVSGSVYQLPTVSISDSAGLTWHNRIFRRVFVVKQLPCSLRILGAGLEHTIE